MRRLFTAGTSKPAEPSPDGHDQAESSSTHSCIFLDAMVALMPNARSLGVAASTLALSLPDGFVKASRVVVGDRSDRISSVIRCRVGDRVGDRDGIRLWPLLKSSGGWIRDGSILVVERSQSRSEVQRIGYERRTISLLRVGWGSANMISEGMEVVAGS